MPSRHCNDENRRIGIGGSFEHARARLSLISGFLAALALLGLYAALHNGVTSYWFLALLGLAIVAVVGYEVLTVARSSFVDPEGGEYLVDLAVRMTERVTAMIAYGAARGMKIDSDVVPVAARAERVTKFDRSDWPYYRALLPQLADAHGKLAEAVAPALPQAVSRLQAGEHHPFLPWLGPVRVVRMLMGLALALVPAFVTLAVITGHEIDFLVKSPPAPPSGTGEKAAVAAYLIIASGIGATFAMLTYVSGKVNEARFDENEEASVWVRLMLGVVAGAILAVVLSRTFAGVIAPGDDDGSVSASIVITVPLLAVIGGFSSDLVYRILQRVIDAIDTVVSGSPAERIASAAESAELRVRREAADERTSFVAGLAQIQELLAAPAPQRDADRVKDLVADILGSLDSSQVNRRELKLSPEDTAVRLHNLGFPGLAVDLVSPEDLVVTGFQGMPSDRERILLVVSDLAPMHNVIIAHSASWPDERGRRKAA